jgi:hypothetical protein
MMPNQQWHIILRDSVKKQMTMKKIILLLFCFSIQFVSAQKSITKEKDPAISYCATLVNGKMVIMQDKKIMENTVVLKNGLKISTDGILIKRNGSKVLLTNGECVNQNGIVEKVKGSEEIRFKRKKIIQKIRS